MYQALGNDAWVASRIGFSRRREDLSWSHHSEFAALDPEDQDFWLDVAEEQNLSQRELRCSIKR